MAEVEQMRREARADAEALRSDAWTTGSQLLEQVQDEVERRREANEREALAIRGEAEREAHRLTAAARREAEDLARSSKMEAEKLLSRARADYEEIVAAAQRQADAAQERTRALEERRRELMDELESIRGTLSSMEQELEERRHGIGLSEPPELPDHAVVTDADGEPIVTDWEEGQTVRVIRPEREEPTVADEVTDAESLAEEVARLHDRPDPHEPVPATDEVAADSAVEETISDESPSTAETEDGQSVVTEAAEPPAEVAPAPEEPAASTADETQEESDEAASDEGATVELEPTVIDEEERDETPETESQDERADDLADLFARLRSPQPEEEESSPSPVDSVETAEDPPPPEAEHEAVGFDGVDPFETRERLLLPITNTVLRTVKRGLADAQNRALEELRLTSGDWQPDPEELESIFAEDLETLADQAGQAGIEAAVEMGVAGTGSVSPDVSPPEGVADELAVALQAALEAAGSGARERQAAASRVFRGWRTDEAERRIRMIAFNAYHTSLRQALEAQGRPWRWLPEGRLCSACRQAAEAGESVPPVHRDCSCTIVPD